MALNSVRRIEDFAKRDLLFGQACLLVACEFRDIDVDGNTEVDASISDQHCQFVAGAFGVCPCVADVDFFGAASHQFVRSKVVEMPPVRQVDKILFGICKAHDFSDNLDPPKLGIRFLKVPRSWVWEPATEA